ncbi:MAG TPA: D-cysteine desulfhydrase family protein [Clostridia bacterium]|nr:D-cysteine desulfhydrase family protein [Clostridia bacterium]
MKNKKLNLANLPTKIEKMPAISKKLGLNIYLKRDDQTGSEISGNKIRKLEYALYEALEQGADTLITCGGIQSNHCRATAAAGAKLGLKTILYLRTPVRQPVEGNYFLDQLLGAEVRFITPKEYNYHRQEIMEEAAQEVQRQGKKAYLIPEGASNGIGTLGYYEAFLEILAQEKQMGVEFDTVVCAVGSAGTYSGLHFANILGEHGKKVVGIPIAADSQHFAGRTREIWQEFSKIIGSDKNLENEKMYLLDGYAGRGYALNTPEEMDFVLQISRSEGVIFDSVYTGKAFRGLVDALEKEHSYFENSKNILFIHTGGLFGLFDKKFEFDFHQ